MALNNRRIELVATVLLLNVSMAGGIGIASQSGRSSPTPLAQMPRAVREEVERLITDDPGKRATAATSLGEMGTSAESAIPYLFAIIGDHRKVLSLTQGSVFVEDVAIEALGKIGQPAISYSVRLFEDQSTDKPSWWKAVYVLASLKRAEVFAPLVSRFNALVDQGIDDRDPTLDAVSQLLTCFPDLRVGDLLVEAAATRLPVERRGRSTTLNLFETFAARAGERFKDAAEARRWWSENREQATLKPVCGLYGDIEKLK